MPSELMLTLEGHSGTVRCLDLNGNRLVSGSTDRTIKVCQHSVHIHFYSTCVSVSSIFSSLSNAYRPGTISQKVINYKIQAHVTIQ